MNDYRMELLELADYFHNSERQHIINTLGYGTDEEIESLVHECNAKLDGRNK
jgi:hypothetical protein